MGRLLYYKIEFIDSILYLCSFVIFIQFVALGARTILFKFVHIIVNTLLFLFYLLDGIYSIIEKQSITDTPLFLLLQTNLSEMSDYIVNHSCFELFSIVLLLFLILVVINAYKRILTWDSKDLYLCFFIMIVLMIGGVFSSPIKDLCKAYENLHSMRERRDVDLSKLVAMSDKPQKNKIHFVIIGESSCRDYWGMYGYEKNTTLNIGNVFKSCEKCAFIRESYSCEKFTESSLAMMLTESNQYNKKKFRESYSLIDVFNKAGIETYWISNQNVWGNENSSFNSIAQTAKYKYFIQPRHFSYLDERPLDEHVLEVLDSIDLTTPSEKVIFIHLMGSHAPYRDRYSSLYNKFDYVDDNKNSLGDYLNSLLYTDYVLHKIYRFSLDHNMSTFSFISDHGELPGVGRDKLAIEMFRIPVFFIFNDMNPSFYNIMNKAKRGIPFTNDLFFDTLIGIVGVHTNVYKQEFDYSSTSYILNTSNILLKSGELTIDSDGKLVKSKTFLKANTLYLSNSYSSNEVMRAFGDGWSNFENWGVWSEGNVSRLTFTLSEPVTKLELLIQPFVAESREEANITIEVNGRCFDEKLSSRKILRYSFDATKNVDIIFKHKIPKSPLELNINDDDRKINIGIVSFVLYN